MASTAASRAPPADLDLSSHPPPSSSSASASSSAQQPAQSAESAKQRKRTREEAGSEGSAADMESSTTSKKRVLPSSAVASSSRSQANMLAPTAVKAEPSVKQEPDISGELGLTQFRSMDDIPPCRTDYLGAGPEYEGGFPDQTAPQASQQPPRPQPLKSWDDDFAHFLWDHFKEVYHDALAKKDSNWKQKLDTQKFESQRALEEARAAGVQDVMQVRQSMLLDQLALQKKHDEKITALRREKVHVQMQLDRLVEEKTELLHMTQTRAAQLDKALSSLAARTADVESLEHQRTVMQEDINELRRIENEDAAKRRREVRGLPPAYGTQDDEDTQPPYAIHRDFGALELRHLDSPLLAWFQQSVRKSSNKADKLRASADENERVEGCNYLFLTLSKKFSESCILLKSILEWMTDESSQRAAAASANRAHSEGAASGQPVIKTEPGVVEAGRFPLPPVEMGNNLPTTGNFPLRLAGEWTAADERVMALTIPRIILELGWDLVSACEARPLADYIEYNDNEKARLALMYADVDEILTDALCFALESSSSSSSSSSALEPKLPRLYEYQKFHTRITALRDRFQELGIGIRFQYFNRAFMWLDEHVDAERVARGAVQDE